MRKFFFNKTIATGGGATAMDGIDTVDVTGDGSNRKLVDGSVCFIIGEADGESKIYVARKVTTPTADTDKVILPVSNSEKFEWQLVLHADLFDGEPPTGYLIETQGATIPAGYDLYYRKSAISNLLTDLAPWVGTKALNAVMGTYQDYLYLIDGSVNNISARYDLVLGGDDQSVTNPPAAISEFTARNVIGTKIYFFDSKNSVTRTFDMNGHTWGLKATLTGDARDKVVSCYDGSKVYLCGGYKVSDSSFVRAIYEYDPGLDTYTYKTDLPGTWEALDMVYNSDDGLIYILTEDAPTSIVSYNSSTNVFDETLADAPQDIGYSHHNTFYNSNYGLIVKLIHEKSFGYDYVTDTWGSDLPYKFDAFSNTGAFFDTVAQVCYAALGPTTYELYRVSNLGDTVVTKQ